MSAEADLERVVDRLPMVVLVSSRLGRQAVIPLHSIPTAAARMILRQHVESPDEWDEALRDGRAVYLTGAGGYEQMMAMAYGPDWRSRDRVSSLLLRVEHLPR